MLQPGMQPILQPIMQPIMQQCRNIIKVTNPSVKTSNFFGCDFHSSKWNLIEPSCKRLKYDSDKRNSDVVKESKGSPPKKEQTRLAKQDSSQFPKIKIHEDFGGVKGCSGFNFPAVSTARVTISNKARDYIEQVRRQKKFQIMRTVQNSTGVIADKIIHEKNRNPVDIDKDGAGKFREMNGMGTGNFLVSASSRNVHVADPKKFFDAPKAVPPKSSDGTYLNNKQKEVSLAAKDRIDMEIERAVAAFRSDYKKKNADSQKDRDVFSHRKVSSRRAGKKESLFHKYSVKKAGALHTEELTNADIDQPSKKPLKYTLNVTTDRNSSRNVHIPKSLSGDDSDSGSRKNINTYSRMQMKHSKKNQKHGTKHTQSKCDEILAKLGLAGDRNKINGDLRMNFLDVLENVDPKKEKETSGNENKSNLNDLTREDLVKKMMSTGDEGSDETDHERRKRLSKKRKQDNPINIDKFWGIGTQNQYEGSSKWKIVSRVPKGKSKRRKMNLRKRKSKIMRSRKGKLNKNENQTKKSERTKPEECGDLSQNE